MKNWSYSVAMYLKNCFHKKFVNRLDFGAFVGKNEEVFEETSRSNERMTKSYYAKLFKRGWTDVRRYRLQTYDINRVRFSSQSYGWKKKIFKNDDIRKLNNTVTRRATANAGGAASALRTARNRRRQHTVHT